MEFSLEGEMEVLLVSQNQSGRIMERRLVRLSRLLPHAFRLPEPARPQDRDKGEGRSGRTRSGGEAKGEAGKEKEKLRGM
jgi:hypothetical protein